MRAIKLIDSINLKRENNKYDLVEVIFESDDSDVLDCSDLKETPIETSTKVVGILYIYFSQLDMPSIMPCLHLRFSYIFSICK